MVSLHSRYNNNITQWAIQSKINNYTDDIIIHTFTKICTHNNTENILIIIHQIIKY